MESTIQGCSRDDLELHILNLKGKNHRDEE